MKKFRTLVLMQLKDKLKTRGNTKKERLRSGFIELIRFVVIAAASFGVFYLLTTFVFSYDETPRLLVLTTTVTTILSTIVSTIGLMQSLYFADDNKVLITLPVASNLIFMSKIVVYYLYELKKNLTFFIPIFISGVLILAIRGLVSPLTILWAIVPLLFILMLPVLVGALLSIPAMLITRFFKRFPILQVVVSLPLLGGVVWLIISLIRMIPQNIDLINRWPFIKKDLRSFLLFVEEKFSIFSHMVYGAIGEQSADLHYHLTWMSFVRVGGLILLCALLFGAAFLVSRPIFFGMMSKTFETNKSAIRSRPNHRSGKYFTFVKKEFFITIRSVDIPLNYLIIYIVVPIMIMFLNALYHVMDTRQLGDLLICTFNVLLICLPMLASNALVATYYSKEGRAGYLKRTKPIYALYPLFAKLIFNMLFSIPAVFVTVAIFGSYSGFSVLEIIVLGFAVLTLHLGHMVYSAMLDVMNPQNEQYATTGTAIDNPNENKSTIMAFIWSALYALCAYKFLSEATIGGAGSAYLPGLIKLLLISLAVFFSVTLLFVKRVRAFYYELQG